MFNAFQIWYAALSTAAKVGVVSGAVVTGTAATSVFPVSSPPATPPAIAGPLEQKVIECKPSVENVDETEAISFANTTEDDPDTASGKTYIKTEGVNGLKTFIYKVTKYSPNGCAEDLKELVRESITIQPVAQVTASGTYVAPPPPKPKSNCDPNYDPCVPNVSYDLDCPDIGFSVNVIGSDPHGFDRDRDGYGCESY